MLSTILAGICLLLLVVYLFLIWPYDYWQKRGVNGPKPLPFVGNYLSTLTLKRNIVLDIQDIDKKSDFIFGNNPFMLTGDEWKERRAEVTLGLTMNRIKNVFPVTEKICKSMVEYIAQQSLMASKVGINANELSLRFTCEVVTDCVLGVKAEAFTNESSVILEKTKNIFEQTPTFKIYSILHGLFPWIQKYKKVNFVPKPIEIFFVDLMQNVLSMRKAQIEEGINVDRADFLNYMLHLQDKKNLDLKELTAHTMTFLLDGFLTTANVLSHCLLLLGRDSKRQQILREEITENLKNINDFEKIMDLPYLDASIHETLRLFPPVSFNLKMCTEPAELENSNGHKLHVEPGTAIVIPTLAIMTDENHYENPLSFVPERFLNGGLKRYKEQGLFLGFGDGPRICLGMRFALAQLKTALVEIIRNYYVHINPKTRQDNKFDPIYFMLRLDGGIWLDFEKLIK
ncbi:probable cytochrome P450 28d1 [Musca vetustissima]|uniref:probable cytochrome P450 28d1 n=1 Tax=Musca vetustissima TaxID=27455 RepID=UPI002AB690D4|nr:probable cytochrome P450 28d1 [Musca vetustissima]